MTLRSIKNEVSGLVQKLKVRKHIVNLMYKLGYQTTTVLTTAENGYFNVFLKFLNNRFVEIFAYIIGDKISRNPSTKMFVNIEKPIKLINKVYRSQQRTKFFNIWSSF